MMKANSDNLEQAIEVAVKALKDGGIVSIPTETVYGLAASIYSENALIRIFKTKDRPFFDPLIVHVFETSEARSLCREWPEWATYLAESFWPGPLTFVLPKSDVVRPLITASHDTVALRCPAHPVAREILKRCGFPLAAPSANRFGRTSPTSAEHVRSEFPDQTFPIVDGGPCEIGIESTILGWSEVTKSLEIFRPGMISAEDIQVALHSKHCDLPIQYAEKSKEAGHLDHHYQPAIPLFVFSEKTSVVDIEQRAKDSGLMGSGIELRMSAEPSIAARQIYGDLRRLGAGIHSYIFIRWPNDYDLEKWLPILDRVKRASTYFQIERSRVG